MGTKYTKSAFFSLLGPTVVQVRQEGSPMFPSVRLAQNWLETGGTIHDWNNLGGYKVGTGSPNAYWKGASVSTSTWEVYDGQTVTTMANWRAYDSVYDFYKDQDLLFGKSRYTRVCAAETPEDQCAALYACGYATDPDYASKLLAIINANGLTKYDEEANGMTAAEKAEFEALQKTVKEQAALIASLTVSKDYLKAYVGRIATRVSTLEGDTVEMEAPAWFIAEFGSADLGGLINTPKGTEGFWRDVAVAARLIQTK